MDREKFEDWMKNRRPEGTAYDQEYVDGVIRASIDSNMSDGQPRGSHNLIIVMEELAELSQEVAKKLRGKEDRTGLLEELADVALGVFYLQEICNIDDDELKRAMLVKIDRLHDGLAQRGYFN